MKNKVSVFLLLLFFLHSQMLHTQNNILIPAFTAYAIPTEEYNENGDSFLFSEPNGLQNWTNINQQIKFFFKLQHTGKIGLSILIKNNNIGNKIKVLFAGNTYNVDVPKSTHFKKIFIGFAKIDTTGFYDVTMYSIVNKSNIIADIKSIELFGEASKNIQFNNKPRRNAASVHLMYPVDDTLKTVAFYNEITITKGSDLNNSYFMACGFARGYFGIQVNSPNERRVIFSIWDAGNEAVDRNKVNENNKVTLMAKGDNVFTDGFGNEGTGGHSHWVYNWTTNITYKFLVTAAIDSVNKTTNYAGYFYVPEKKQWKLIACFKAPKDGKYLSHLYSFVENFDGSNGQLFRKANFGNQWIRLSNGTFKEITSCKFSYDATAKAGDRIDFGAGVDNNTFYLWNGGFKNSTATFNQIYLRQKNEVSPTLDLYKNYDSIFQLKTELIEINTQIKNLKLDTTGSINNVYYKILKQGTGNFISITDTVIVHYKGQLLNGFVFDETKDKPATFPLSRLIKGWQIGLPLCKIGGKIRLIIPSYLAYGTRNLTEIPPNNTLIFDIELIGIKGSK